MLFGCGDNPAAAPETFSKLVKDSRYYEDFETYLMAVLGFGQIVEASNCGQAIPCRPNDVVRFDCKQSDGNWYWRPEPSVRLFSANIAPKELFIHRNIGLQPPADAVLNLGSIDQLLFNFGQALATNYYERLKPTVREIYGSDTTFWPSVWNFSRIVRNAMSHGGKIKFDNPNAHAVKWKELSYAPIDNGRQILNNDIWPGDIFDLIIEMDSILNT
jgi:hypothetical protein